MSPSEFFEKEYKANLALAEEFARSVRQLSILRFLIFIIFLIVFTLFANQREGSGLVITVLVFPVVFGIVVKRFNKKTYLRQLHETVAQRMKEELLRLDNTLDSLDGGNEYIDRNHPYSYDLDLFGKHSLFKLLNRTATPAGRTVLVDWMCEGPDPVKIERRQQAIEELRKDPLWLVQFLSEGNVTQEIPEKTGDLKVWLLDTRKVKVISNYLAMLLAILFLTVLVSVIWFGIPIYALMVPALINIFILRRMQPVISEITRETGGNMNLLKGYERMIRMFQEREFNSPMLQDLHQPFHPNTQGAIASLRRYLDYLNGRSNMFYAIFDLVFLFDVYLVNGIYKWKEANRKDMSCWFDNIAVFEALSSLSLFAYSNHSYTFPVIISSGFSWEGRELGHPLIARDERVTNDFTFNEPNPLAIITGSNMSGKSTFLRTVGLNTVLANMGSVVCAKKLSLTCSELFTAMRTEDDLKSHISSFYAELQRIRALLDSLNERRTLCLLDEILKGTNTEDRHRGAMGLMNQLFEHGVAGLVSTHDLELGRWGKSNNYANYSFNSTIEGNEILFDYKISEGVCHSFNASQLMKNMGIKLPDDNPE